MAALCHYHKRSGGFSQTHSDGTQKCLEGVERRPPSPGLVVRMPSEYVSLAALPNTPERSHFI